MNLPFEIKRDIKQALKVYTDKESTYSNMMDSLDNGQMVSEDVTDLITDELVDAEDALYSVMHQHIELLSGGKLSQDKLQLINDNKPLQATEQMIKLAQSI